MRLTVWCKLLDILSSGLCGLEYGAARLVEEVGCGAIVWSRQEGERGEALVCAKLKAKALHRRGHWVSGSGCTM